jgi:two-component system, NarL family, response regulator
VIIETGWNPPLPSDRIVNRILDDIGHITNLERRKDKGSAIKVPTLQLPPRELSILQLSANGNSRAEIAKELGIGVETVKALSSSLRHRLNAKNAAHAVAIGMRKGIIS